jgi:hypothetical protein
VAVNPTFPSRDVVRRRLVFRPLGILVGAAFFLLLYLVIRVGASAHVPIPRGKTTTISTSPAELPVVPSSPPPEPKALLASYAKLAEQLGGQYAVRHGAPAAALAALADEHRVTEMLLARRIPARAGHHPVLRELARASGGAEVRVVPAEHSSEQTRSAGP